MAPGLQHTHTHRPPTMGSRTRSLIEKRLLGFAAVFSFLMRSRCFVVCFLVKVHFQMN